MSGAALVEPAREADAASRAAIAGFVEARTRDRILGWAWDAADPPARQRVVLLAGDRVVARTLADQPRDDLARNGIGDGAHAFAFALDDTLRPEAAVLDVAVEGSDGALVRLPSAAAGEAQPSALGQVQRGLATLAAGQRALMRAIGAAAGPDHAATLAAIAEQQERIERSVRALEVFVCRLDERLAAAAVAPAARVSVRPLLLAGLFGAAGMAALAWALAPVLA